MTDYADLEKRLRAWASQSRDDRVALPTGNERKDMLLLSAADAISALTKQVEDLEAELVDARLEPWPEWADKLLRILQEFGAEYEADDEIDLPDELREWLHHYASDIKQAAERRRLSTASDAENSGSDES